MQFFNRAVAKLMPVSKSFTEALLRARFRAEFEQEYGKQLFTLAEIDQKMQSNKIIPDLIRQGKLENVYRRPPRAAKQPSAAKKSIFTVCSSIWKAPIAKSAKRHIWPGRSFTKRSPKNGQTNDNCSTCVSAWRKSWTCRIIPRWATSVCTARTTAGRGRALTRAGAHRDRPCRRQTTRAAGGPPRRRKAEVL